jgi:hypothetical protein
MQPSPHFASASLPAASNSLTPSRHLEDVVYQAVTIASMLMLLGSMWVF